MITRRIEPKSSTCMNQLWEMPKLVLLVVSLSRYCDGSRGASDRAFTFEMVLKAKPSVIYFFNLHAIYSQLLSLLVVNDDGSRGATDRAFTFDMVLTEQNRICYLF